MRGADARHRRFANVNDGPLVDACGETGAVSWTDTAGQLKKLTLGQRATRLLPRRPYRR